VLDLHWIKQSWKLDTSDPGKSWQTVRIGREKSLWAFCICALYSTNVTGFLWTKLVFADTQLTGSSSVFATMPITLRLKVQSFVADIRIL